MSVECPSRRAVLGLLLSLMTGCAVPPAPTMSAATPIPEPTPTRAPTAQPTSTPMPSPTPRPSPTASPTPTPTDASPMITVTIVYDNNAHTAGLTTQWGFACLIEIAARTVLFDTGGDAPTLLANMEALDKTPQAVDVVVLSHHHGDHTGGLQGLLNAGARPTVYAPASFSPGFKRDVRARTDLIEVTDRQEIAPGLVTTGEVPGPIPEQALAVQVREGWVLVTGCAHPGIVTMAQVAQQATDGGDLTLVMGGFHLGSASAQQITRIITQLQDRGVDQVAPTHCTGARARAMFAEAFGDHCHLVGAGSTFTFET